MPGLLAANYLGFSGPDMGLVYAFFAALAGLLVFLIVYRGFQRLRELHVERQSAWRTFRKIARARGLSRQQAVALETLARAARLKRPAQVMGSLLVFDRAMERVQDRGALPETQLILLESARQKLATTAEVHDERTERRQLERIDCALKVNVLLVTRDDLEQEMRSTDLGEAEAARAKLQEMGASVEPAAGQVTNLCAGGMAILVDAALEVRERDFVGVAGDASGWPLDLNGLWSEVLSCLAAVESATTSLHLRFFSCPAEKKREIIQWVYRVLEERSSGGKATRGKKAVRRSGSAPSAVPASRRPLPAGQAQSSDPGPETDEGGTSA